MSNPPKKGLPLLLMGLLFAACTMPLPREVESPSVIIPDTLPGGASALAQSVILQQGRYGEGFLSYLDVTTCVAENCINRLRSLSPLLRYEFFFSDKSPVLGQQPVFNNPTSALSPFRRVIQVTVPDGYQPNSLRSSEDVLNSGFRTEATNRVENNPLIAPDLSDTEQQVQSTAWSGGESVSYLELGTVPYSVNQNRLGVGVAYFMRNRDRTDLPSQPLPIFDSVPGDLLYSPIRQVFRAISENQIESESEDPARTIRSQEDLLRAVNEGRFELEDTQEYFNYPVVALQSSPTQPPEQPLSQARFDLSLQAPRDLPPLPTGHYYALWVTNTLNQARLLLQFQSNANGSLSNLNGEPLNLSTPIFRFSNTEVGSFRQFLLTVEENQGTEPTGSTLLEAPYAGRSDTLLEAPFANTYSALQDATFMLVAPTDLTGINHRSGLWFVQRTDERTQNAPLALNLDPGVILSLPPRGWVYNGWIRNSLGNDFWLETGRFNAVNRPDQQALYYDSTVTAYPYPGEDFLRNAPQGVFFPINLPSSGEREVVISLEPENLNTQKPFFALYRRIIAKGTPPLTNQTLPFTPVRFPTLNLHLERVNAN